MCLQSCLDLKNYEAVFSIVAGLDSIQRIADSWQVRLILCMHVYNFVGDS